MVYLVLKKGAPKSLSETATRFLIDPGIRNCFVPNHVFYQHMVSEKAASIDSSRKLITVV